MKKSNALMLSYIIFLVSTIIAQIFFKWDGLDRIAMATTAAGCFFAVADYCGWRASFAKTCYEKLQELSNILREFSQIKRDTVEMQNRQLSNAIETFLPYKATNEDIDSWIIEANKLLEKNEQTQAGIDATITTCNTINPKISKGLKRSQYTYIVEMIFAVLGFIVFFTIIAFDYFALVITPYQSFITIFAFATIMCTYYHKDLYEEKWEQELAQTKELAEKIKQEAIDANEETKQLNIEDALKKFREIKEQKHQPKTGGNENG